MTPEMLSFLTRHFVTICIFCLLAGGGLLNFFANIIRDWQARRRELKIREIELRLATERRLLAEKTVEALDLLMAHPLQAQDFSDRLAERLRAKQAEEGGAPEARVRVDAVGTSVPATQSAEVASVAARPDAQRVP